ncbi:MAG: hypothetical protein AABZ06_04820, partial [Bdellovibrionota bacterium]
LLRRENLGKEPVGIIPFKLENDFITGTKQRLQKTENLIIKAKKGVEKAIRAYLAARKQTLIIEKLYEKALGEFKKQLGKRHEKEMNDLFLMRDHAREKIV